MSYRTIISAEKVHENLDNPDWIIVDCRFYLDEPDQGRLEYLESHIPGAIYVHLDDDLSGEIIPGRTGRHPLPDSKVFADRVANWGIANRMQVIAYDRNGGALAGRLWWMLRWLGHEKVAVLNGDWKAWTEGDYPLERGNNSAQRKEFVAEEHPEYIVDAAEVEILRQDENIILLDARSPQRYWGLEEPIDTRAGHIPGAITAPYEQNLDPGGYFLSAEALRERYENLLEGIPPSQVIVYCGSGVTSTHHLIAMMEAGYEMALLYPGSWSEWITDPDRPVSSNVS
jgi:thiosulfate/3-mercaptopyruvate sulfurtransferase